MKAFRKYAWNTLLILYMRVRSVAVTGLIWTIPLWLLWNWLMPSLFGLRPVLLEEALGLSLFLAIVRQ